MKAKPILFQGGMINALLREIASPGTGKTMTRRVAKGLMNDDFEFQHEPEFKILGVKPEALKKCPYGQPGDLLWVRETWVSRTHHYHDGIERSSVCYRATPRIGTRTPGVIRDIDQMRYLEESTPLETHSFGWPITWKPSIFMPRWASRITLQITGARVERLQNIREEDAFAEGSEPIDFNQFTGDEIELLDYPLTEYGDNYRNGFAFLWESINGRNSWQSNPWVWVVEFRPILANVEAVLADPARFGVRKAA